MIHISLARDRISDAEIGWRPAPEKNMEIARKIASWTWDVTHKRALSLANLLRGKTPVKARIGLLKRIC
jgi:hypothetical protein